MNSLSLVCLVAVASTLAVACAQGDWVPSTVPGTPAYPDPRVRKIGAEWTCYVGWDVVG